MATKKIVSGVEFPAEWSLFQVELFLFYWGTQLAENPYWRPKGSIPGMSDSSVVPYEGEGRFEHFKNLAKMWFPKSFEWHDWSEKAGRAFCEQKHIAITGCGGSGKSTAAALYAIFFLLAAPNDSAVLIASTSIDAAKKRIWKNIRQYYSEMIRKCRRLGDTCLIGNPRPCIRSSKTDTAHGIYVVAVAKGEVEKGVEALKGFHPKRLLMIGGETDSIGQAVVDVGVNQEIGTIEYQTIWLGNDPSLFNPLGKMMEPEPGKPVTLGHVEWKSTTGVHCLRFDAFDSPNIRDKDKWAGIVRQKDIDAAIARHGANSPQVWIMLRGIHPPEGADDTVLSEALLVRHNCREKVVVWQQSFIRSGMLDPAFGGDRCVFRMMDRGIEQETGKMKVLFHDPVEIQINANDKTSPAEYQIAAKTKSLCESNGIPPDEFITDSTGTGRGVASVLQREWSPNINVCEFGGACSDMPVSDENPKPASEEYDRKVTELWYSFRVFVEADMVRGLDAATALEFCQRRFVIKGKKVSVETKTEMKLRGLPSPDFADPVAEGIELLRRKGVNAQVMTDVKKASTGDLNDFLRKNDLDAREDCYAEDTETDGTYD
jgi:hypothetical protein